MTVSAAPRAALFTMGPGDELFSKFGHAALCIVDPEMPGGGLCYNYGTSDFSRPVGLGWDVVRGRAKFWVSVSDVITMLVQFQAQDRTIHRQWLPLSAEQVATLERTLALDASPANREYVYSHFLDNCSTRPRDLIDEATDGALSRSTLPNERTYRDYARAGFASSQWGLVPAGDLILGRWVDQDISVYEAMFIPTVLRAAVERAFGAEPETVYERQSPRAPADVSGALRLFWLVVAAASFIAWLVRPGARLVAAVLAMVGGLIWAGALVSPWPELRINELLLVFVPLDVLLLRRGGAVPRRYLDARLIALGVVAVLALAGLFVQPIWPYWVLATSVVTAFWWRSRRDILAR